MQQEGEDPGESLTQCWQHDALSAILLLLLGGVLKVHFRPRQHGIHENDAR